MATRKRPEPAPIIIKEFSREEIERGIAKLKRRVEEVRALDPQKTPYNDESVNNVERNIRDSILEIFLENSPEYNSHRYHEIWHGPHIMGSADYERQNCFAEGIPQTIKVLEGLIARLGEKREDLGYDPIARAKTVFQDLALHAKIAGVCSQLYQDGHYSDAVFAASKALINFVKEKSGQLDLDGAPLVRTVFSPKAPLLAFNDLSDQSDADEQEGMMHLFEGAVLGIRNPRGHAFLDDAPERALEYIMLISLLANRLEEAKKRK